MKLIDLLEMPVKHVSWSLDSEEDVADLPTDDYRFTAQDRKYINSQSYPDIVIKKLTRTPFDLYVYIRDNEYTRQYTSMVSGDKTQGYVTGFIDNDDKILEMIGPRANSTFLKNRTAGVHLLVAHNDPYADRYMPLTPWMILHRLSHAVLDHYGKNNTILDTNRAELWSIIGRLSKFLPMKSAATADEYEKFVESLAYYWYTGGNFKIIPAEENLAKQELIDRLITLYAEITPSLIGKMWIG